MDDLSLLTMGVVSYELGEMREEDKPKFFQALLDTGLIRQMPSKYHLHLQALQAEGKVKRR